MPPLVQHGLHSVDVIFGSAQSWAQLPSRPEIEREISLAVLAQSEIAEVTLGFYKPPRRVRKIDLTLAALDQINCMWHGFRARSADAPPPIPLHYFVIGFGQEPPDTWVDIEVHPGVARWDATQGGT